MVEQKAVLESEKVAGKTEKQVQVKKGKKKTKKSSNMNMRLARTLHVYVSMLVLLVMLFFTLTGLTLNHREWLPEPPALAVQELVLPDALQTAGAWEKAPLDQADKVRRWLRDSYQLTGSQVSYDWQADEVLLLIDIKRPGGYSLVEVEPFEGIVLVEAQSYGLMSLLNDLHMGRYSGAVWRGFIDASALLMLLFTLTGLWLVLPQKKRRWRLFSLASVGGIFSLMLYQLFVLG